MEITKNESGKTTILALAGKLDLANAAKLKEAGIDRVVNKPAPCEDLRHIIFEMVTPE